MKMEYLICCGKHVGKTVRWFPKVCRCKDCGTVLIYYKSKGVFHCHIRSRKPIEN